MKLVLSVWLLVVHSIFAGVNIDSLKKEADKFTGEKKIDFILQSIDEIPGGFSKEKISLAKEALTLSDKIGYIKGKGISLNKLATNQYNIGEYDNAWQNYLKALSYFKKEKDSVRIGLVLTEIGYVLERNYKYDSALVVHKDALKCLLRFGQKNDLAISYNNIGLIIWRNGAFAEALPFFEKALEIRKEIKNNKAIGMSNNNIGTLYYRWGNYEKALQYYQQSLNYREIAKDTHGLVLSLNNIGLVYQKLNYLDKAADNFEEAIRISELKKFSFGKAYTYHNLGQLYKERKDYQTALKYALKSLDSYTLIKDLGGSISSLCDIGDYHENMGNLPFAYQYYQKSLANAISAEDRYSTSRIYHHLGRVTNKMKEYDKSIEFLEKSLEMSKKQGLNEIIKNNYWILSKNYSSKSDYKKAYDYMMLFNDLKDSLYNQKLDNDLANWRVKYETEKKINENKALISENTAKQAEIEKQKLLTNLLILASIIILVISVFVYRLYYLKKKSNLQIIEQKNELEKLNILLDEQNKELNEINNTKDKLFSIIGHDLKNPFQALVGFSDVMVRDIESLDKEQILLYSRNLHESSKSLLTLTRNLLDWAKVQSLKITLVPIELNMKLLVDDLINAYQFNISQKSLSVENKIDEGLSVYADANMCGSVFRNLLSNAIKFTNPGGSIIINAEAAEEECIFSVEDSGIGLTGDEIEKLFNIKTNFSKKGTNQENGTGLGLILCKDFVEKNGGRIWVESEVGKGSSFRFSVPVKN